MDPASLDQKVILNPFRFWIAHESPDRAKLVIVQAWEATPARLVRIFDLRMLGTAIF